jgi:hypothetical protein
MADRSPFPGMDPWLEGYWGDIHATIITDFADQIATQLPAELIVRVEEMVYVIDPIGEQGRVIKPDVAMFSLGGERPPAPEQTNTAVAEPIRIMIPDESVTEGFIEIRELRQGHPLVTAIEVLSPTNKCSAMGRSEYLRKRDGYYQAKINVVELDLIRAGRHLVGVPAERIQSTLNAPYKCVVRHGGAMAGVGVDYYPLRLRERLPRIAIPLRPADPPAIIDMQRPIDHAYQRGGYGRVIDYNHPPDPPLSPEDTAWAAERVVAARTAAS